ncbi:MAG: M48 family metallopeptidase, partial [Proteobacteria bacterium]|nr:M48 family metallopeptidase [Pseudomonadota bacterium]
VATLCITYLAPAFILPLFNTFTPLEAGELRTAIEGLAVRAGFALSGVFIMDGSKRSTKGNAFFTGLGNKKRIALFDTLVEDQSVEEISGVLAHEIGHSKLGHIRKRLVVSILKTGVIFWLLSLFLHNRELFEAFSMTEMSTHAGLIFFALLYTPVSLALSVVSSAVSRKHEFEADAYAAQLTGHPADLASALKKLSAKNLSNLTPHPLMVWLHYSHPPVMQRLERLAAA